MNRTKQYDNYHKVINHPDYKKLGYTDRTMLEYLAFGMTLQDVAEEFKFTKQEVHRRKNKVFRKLGIELWTD